MDRKFKPDRTPLTHESLEHGRAKARELLDRAARDREQPTYAPRRSRDPHEAHRQAEAFSNGRETAREILRRHRLHVHNLGVQTVEDVENRIARGSRR